MRYYRDCKKSWRFHFNNYKKYNRQGFAMVYYRKTDIANVLNTFAEVKRFTAENLPKPEDDWNGYCNVGYLVTETVSPFRVVR